MFMETKVQQRSDDQEGIRQSEGTVNIFLGCAASLRSSAC